MKNHDSKIIYNIPEEISGLGCASYFIGFGLIIVLLVCAIPCVLIDKNWLADSLELIISSGIFVILAFGFIFVVCPTFFFVRFLMELIRTHRNRQKFYSTPNIKYIQLNNDTIDFKNTIDKNDFSINKSEIKQVILTGSVKTVMGISAQGTPKPVTYVEDLTLTIQTNNEHYVIYPASREMDTTEQIKFYKSYFDNFDVVMQK